MRRPSRRRLRLAGRRQTRTRPRGDADTIDPDLLAAIVVATLTHKAVRRREAAPRDAQLLAGQPALRLALGGDRTLAPEPELAAEGEVMRRYTLHIRGREYVIDVQELTADSFEVVVGNEAYAVTLTGDEDVAEAAITPELEPRPSTTPGGPTAGASASVARSAPSPRRRALGRRAVGSKSRLPPLPLRQETGFRRRRLAERADARRHRRDRTPRRATR